MNRKLIVGVMGGGSASAEDIQSAYHLGSLIAAEGWILLNGGRKAGIMEASAKGAYEKGGLTIGILAESNATMASPYIQVPIITGMGHARNSINVLSSDVVVACPGGAGTLSEIALALKCRVPIVGLQTWSLISPEGETVPITSADSPEEAVEAALKLASLK